MHRVQVTALAVRAGRPVSDRELTVVGFDLDGGELVTFNGDRLMLEEFAARHLHDGTATLEIGVAYEDFIDVFEPVSGEWDSPGTSPEEYDDETF